MSVSAQSDTGVSSVGADNVTKILQIGNYPPPACGWSVQTKLLAEEIRRRGHVCEVLNINENRRVKSAEYVDVQNGFDYVLKLCRFALKGFRFQVNVNGQSKPGYMLALIALLIGRSTGHVSTLSWRGGVEQKYFPRGKGWLRCAYGLLFRLAGSVSCDSTPVKRAIESYGIHPDRVVAIPPFSKQNLSFTPVDLSREAEAFLSRCNPVFFCYVSYRPEYELPILREAMRNFRKDYPNAGFVWLGFPSKEIPAVEQYVAEWTADERIGLLLLGNLNHDEFMSLLSRCTAYIRTPMCDGVAASILESLALGIPVVASDNGTRPSPVIRYRDRDEAHMRAKLAFVLARYEQVKEQTRLNETDDNIEMTVQWLLRAGAPSEERSAEFVHAR